jgi:hypothetical protein
MEMALVDEAGFREKYRFKSYCNKVRRDLGTGIGNPTALTHG